MKLTFPVGRWGEVLTGVSVATERLRDLVAPYVARDLSIVHGANVCTLDRSCESFFRSQG